MPVAAVHAPRFNVTTQREEFLSHLEEHGFSIAASVLDGPSVDEAKHLMWDLLEDSSGRAVDRDDVATWDAEHGWRPNVENGLLSTHGAGQSDCMWYIRLQPRVKEAFRAIWETDDLLVSFTGCNAFRPWQHDPSWRTRGGWYHVDQNATRPGRAGKVCVQGLVTLTDADESTGGLIVVSRSHTKHEELCETHELQGVADYLPLQHDHRFLCDGAQLVCARAGDLIVWDSRTIHCNSPALLAASSPSCELLRMAAYVTMMPASCTSQTVIRQRWHAYENNHGSSHWTDRLVPCGYNDLPLKPCNGLSSEQVELIGRSTGLVRQDEVARCKCCLM